MKAPCVGMQGKMLPSVTEEDNGDVLTVVNGEWSKAPGGGGGTLELFRINGTTDAETGDVYFDKTFAEVKDAWLNGMLPYLIMKAGTSSVYYSSLDQVQFVSSEPSAFAFELLSGSTVLISE